MFLLNSDIITHIGGVDMTTLLSRLFIKDRENFSSPKVRGAYGMLFGAVGIFLNVILYKHTAIILSMALS